MPDGIQYIDADALQTMTEEQVAAFKQSFPAGTQFEVRQPEPQAPAKADPSAPPTLERDAFKAMTPEQLAEFAVKTKWSPYTHVQMQPDLETDEEAVTKLAQTDLLLRKRGFKLADVDWKGIPAAGWHMIKGAVDYAGNLATAVTSPVAEAVNIATGGKPGVMLEEGQKKAFTNIAASELGATGTIDLLRRGVEKAGRFIGASKSLDEYTPEDAKALFRRELGIRNQVAEISKGKGAVAGDLVGDVQLDPEAVSSAAAGDPLTFMAFGGGFKILNAATGKALGMASSKLGAINAIKSLNAQRAYAASAEKLAAGIPSAENLAAANQAAIDYFATRAAASPLTRAGQVVGDLVEKIPSTAQVVGKTAEVVGKGIEKVAPLSGIAAAIHGLTVGHPAELLALMGGRGGRGILAGTLEKAGKGLAEGGAKLAAEQIPGGTWTRAVSDVLNVPQKVIAGGLHGLPMDLALGAVTAGTPEETRETPLLMSFFGALKGATGGARGVVQGQLTAPRPWTPSSAWSKNYGNFPAFDEAHRATMGIASDGIKERVGALRDLADGNEVEVFQFQGAEDLAQALRKSAPYMPEGDVVNAANANAVFYGEMPDVNGVKRKVILMRDPVAAPHEIGHPLEAAFTSEAQARLYAEVEKQYGERGLIERAYREAEALATTPEAKAEMQRDWVGFLLRFSGFDKKFGTETPTPEQARDLVKLYATKEIVADTIGTVVEHATPKMLEDKTFLGTTARVVARLMTTLGLDPFKGVTAESPFQTPIKEPVYRTAQELVTPMAPAGEPTPGVKAPPKATAPPVAPAAGSAEAASTAEKAKKWVDENPPETPERAQAATGLADAYAQGKGIRVLYWGAKGDPAGQVTSVRPERRAEIENQRGASNKDRKLIEKEIFPFRVDMTSKGPQFVGWSPDNFDANIGKVAEWLGILARKGTDVSAKVPYGFDKQTGRFTAEGRQQLLADAQTHMDNQRAGFTGAGEELVVPKQVEARGFTAPEKTGAPAKPLEQSRADIINYLFHVQIPETTRRVAPLHLAAQEVSEATLPGRLVEPVRPRGEYPPEKLEKAGIPGPREVLEVNPFRQWVEQTSKDAGVARPSLIDVSQRLNLNRIEAAVPSLRPEHFGGNTLTLAAGFQPSNNPRAIRSPAVRDKESGKVYEGSWHGDALVKALLDKDRKPVDEQPLVKTDDRFEDGWTTNTPNEFLSRENGYARAAELKQIDKAEYDARYGGYEGLETDTFEKTRNFQPRAVEVAKMTPDEFGEWVKTIPTKGFTGVAVEVGKATTTPEGIAELKSMWDQATAESSQIKAAVMKAPSPEGFDTWAKAAGKSQFFREAYESATNTGSMKTFGERQAQPKLSQEPEAIKGAAVQDRRTGKMYTGETHYDALLKAREADPMLDPFTGSLDFEKGFSTNDGKFLNRKAAAKRAREYDQIDDSYTYGDQLESTTFARQRQAQPSYESVVDRGNYPPSLREEYLRTARLMDAGITSAQFRNLPYAKQKQIYDILDGAGGDLNPKYEDIGGSGKLAAPEAPKLKTPRLTAEEADAIEKRMVYDSSIDFFKWAGGNEAVRKVLDKMVDGTLPEGVALSPKELLIAQTAADLKARGIENADVSDMRFAKEPFQGPESGLSPLAKRLRDDMAAGQAQPAAPKPSYEEATKEAATTGGNPWVKLSDSPDNGDRVLMVQFSSDLLQKNAVKDQASDYYDKLYSGSRPGYARLQDFWEIPQWTGFLAKIAPNADLYVVRDMAQAKQFLNEAKYGRVAFSALDVNAKFIKELAEGYDGKFDVGGYAAPKEFEGVPNIKWHDSMKSLAEDMGLPYVEGVDYRHFAGSEVIPRLTMSQGCLHKCAFCTVEKTLKETPMEVVEQQADEIAKLGSKLVYLNDKTFGQAKNYQGLADIYTRIKEQNPDFSGFIVQTTASQLNRIPSEWLAKSGIKFVELGIETYNDPILKEMRKPATQSIMDKSVAKLREHGIALIPNVLIGLPGETPETYANTLAFLKNNKDIISHANVYNLAVYKDAELGKKLTTASEADFDENVLEKSWMTNPEIHRTFAGDLYGMASEMLEGKPESAQFQARKGEVARIEDMDELWAAETPTAVNEARESATFDQKRIADLTELKARSKPFRQPWGEKSAEAVFLDKAQEQGYSDAEINHVLGTELPTAVNEQRDMAKAFQPGYMGALTLDGNVVGHKVESLKEATHEGLGINSDRAKAWRYNPKTDEVYWWNRSQVTTENEVAVNDWLAAHGYEAGENRVHTSIGASDRTWADAHGLPLLGEAGFQPRALKPKEYPKKTATAYKVFRTLPSKPGQIFPLFIGASTPTEVGKWLEAEALPKKPGFALRPGWHTGELPMSPQLLRRDGTMDPTRVWAEVEIPLDVDWQAKADKSPSKDIKGEIPKGGSYKFKEANGTQWNISGAIKVKRILSNDEIRQILTDAGRGEEADTYAVTQPLPGAQAMARRPKDDAKFPKGAVGQEFKKAWILPNGEIQQLGGLWHSDWLDRNRETLKKFGLKDSDIPAFEGTDSDAGREKALRAGLARVNYSINNGQLTVEARAADWRKVRDAYERLVETNLDDIDSVKVTLFNRDLSEVEDSASVQLFRIRSAADQLAALPFLDELQPRKATMRETETPAYQAPGEAPERAALPVPGKVKYAIYDAAGRYMGTTGDLAAAKAMAEGIEGTYKVVQDTSAQAQPAAKFDAPEFPEELEKIVAGSAGGQTFNPDGTIWTSPEEPSDIVSLASVNVPKAELAPEIVKKALQPYAKLLEQAGVTAGIFAFEKDGKQMASIDVNAVVPQKYRDNTLAFAKANDQISLWDAAKGEEVPVGGSGETKLKSPTDIAAALPALLAGSAVTMPSPRASVKYFTGEVPKIASTGARGKTTLWDAAKYLSEENAKRGRIEYGDESGLKDMAEALAEEATYAFSKDKNAIGWYDAKLGEMKAKLKDLHPELNDENQFTVYKALLAINSNGQNIDANLVRSDVLYENWKKTGKLDTTSTWGGKNAPAINMGIQNLQELITAKGLDGAREFLDTDFVAGDLKKLGYEIKGELVSTLIKGSVILGPKIGSFYGNLNGDYTSVTMDRWFMRTFHRIDGTLTDIQTSALRDQFANVLGAFKGKRTDVGHDLGPVREEIHSILQALDDGTFEPDMLQNKNTPLTKWMAARYYPYVSSKFLNRVPQNTTVKNLWENIFSIKHNEKPKNGSERVWIRRVMDETQRLLRAKGIDLTNADLQALLWYYEKDLHGKFYKQTERAKPTDYAEAAERFLAKKRGQQSGLGQSDRGGTGLVEARGGAEPGATEDAFSEVEGISADQLEE